MKCYKSRFEQFLEKNWDPALNHRVCAKHFHADDFVVTSTDNKAKRKNLWEDQTLQRKRYLKFFQDNLVIYQPLILLRDLLIPQHQFEWKKKMLLLPAKAMNF